MKKLMLVLTLLLFSYTSFAADEPRTYIGIDNEVHSVHKAVPCVCGKVCECNPCHCKKTGIIVPAKKKHEQEIDEIVKNIENGPKKQISVRPPIVTKSQRLWVQDVYQDGLLVLWILR